MNEKTAEKLPRCNAEFCPLLQMDWAYSCWAGDACPPPCRRCSVEAAKARAEQLDALNATITALRKTAED